MPANYLPRNHFHLRSGNDCAVKNFDQNASSFSLESNVPMSDTTGNGSPGFATHEASESMVCVIEKPVPMACPMERCLEAKNLHTH